MQITGGVFTQTTCLFSNQGEIRAIGNGSYNNLLRYKNHIRGYRLAVMITEQGRFDK